MFIIIIVIIIIIIIVGFIIRSYVKSRMAYISMIIKCYQKKWLKYVDPELNVRSD
jgi:hypothetical protein